jgi:hypothetical protein
MAQPPRRIVCEDVTLTDRIIFQKQRRERDYQTPRYKRNICGIHATPSD